MTNYIVIRADDSELEHHGIKGQKWGVSRYKKARSEGVSTYSKIKDNVKVHDTAVDKYEKSGKKMYDTSAKRDIIADKAAAAKSGSRKQSRLNKKVDKYNQKAKAYSKERSSAKKEAISSMSDIRKGQIAYSNAVIKAGNENVIIKDHSAAKHLLAAAISIYGQVGNPNLDMFRTKKDAFDETVMEYKNAIRK